MKSFSQNGGHEAGVVWFPSVNVHLTPTASVSIFDGITMINSAGHYAVCVCASIGNAS